MTRNKLEKQRELAYLEMLPAANQMPPKGKKNTKRSLVCDGCLKDFKTHDGLTKHKPKCLAALHAAVQVTNAVADKEGRPTLTEVAATVTPGTTGTVQPEKTAQEGALAALLSIAAVPEQVSKVRLENLIKGFIGTSDAPFINERIERALRGGPLADPDDVAAVSAVTKQWSDLERRNFLKALELPKKGGGIPIVGGDFDSLIAKNFMFKCLAELTETLTGPSAGDAQFTDMILDPAKATLSMELRRARTALGMAPKEHAEEHYQNGGPKQFSRDGRPSRPRKCWACKKEGHLSRDCPTKKKREARDEPPNKARRQES